jgi:nuclear cap-binding protein subunit 1
VFEAYPPRGVIRLLAPEHTVGQHPQLERLVTEDYILDTIDAFDGDRIECARRLAIGTLSLS